MTNGKSHSGAGSSSAVARPVTVTVTINSDSPPDFDIAAAPAGHVPIKKVKKGKSDDFMLEFNNHAGGVFSDGFDITFHLIDKTSGPKRYGFFFADPNDPDPNDAISVKCVDADGHCPPKGSKWDGFKPYSVTRQQLKVNNPNDGYQYFGFALHFSKEGETAPSLTFDPIGDDQNGHFLTK